MTKFKTIAALGLATAMLTGLAGQAQAYTIWVRNSTPVAFWVSVYLYGQHNSNQAAFCVLPGEDGKGSKGTIGNVGGGVYVRVEGKASKKNCNAPTSKNIWDTTTNYVEVSTSNRSMVTFSSTEIRATPTYDASKWH